MDMNKKLTILATLITACATVSAERKLDWVDFYVLGGVGYARVDNATFELQNDPVSFTNQGEIAGFDLLNNSEPDGNIGWRAGFGNWFSQHFGMEFNYYGIADMNAEAYSNKSLISFQPVLATPSQHYQLEVDKMFAFDLTGNGRFFFMPNIYTFGRFGIGYSHIKRFVNSNFTYIPPFMAPPLVINSTLDDSNVSEVGLAAAIGFQWDIIEEIGFRLEGNTIQTVKDDANMYMVSANIVFNISEIFD